MDYFFGKEKFLEGEFRGIVGFEGFDGSFILGLYICEKIEDYL